MLYTENNIYKSEKKKPKGLLHSKRKKKRREGEVENNKSGREGVKRVSEIKNKCKEKKKEEMEKRVNKNLNESQQGDEGNVRRKFVFWGFPLNERNA